MYFYVIMLRVNVQLVHLCFHYKNVPHLLSRIPTSVTSLQHTYPQNGKLSDIIVNLDACFFFFKVQPGVSLFHFLNWKREADPNVKQVFIKMVHIYLQLMMARFYPLNMYGLTVSYAFLVWYILVIKGALIMISQILAIKHKSSSLKGMYSMFSNLWCGWVYLMEMPRTLHFNSKAVKYRYVNIWDFTQWRGHKGIDLSNRWHPRIVFKLSWCCTHKLAQAKLGLVNYAQGGD